MTPRARQQDPAAAPTAVPRQCPVPVRRAAGVLVLEGLALVAVGGLELAKSAGGHPHSVVFAVIQALMAVGAGILLALLARSLVRLRLWARTPTALLQLLALPVAWGLLQSRLWLLAAAVAVPALVVLYLLATPAARLVFRHEGYGQ